MRRSYPYIGHCLVGFAVGVGFGIVWMAFFGPGWAPIWLVALVAACGGFIADPVVAAVRRRRARRVRPRKVHAR